MMNTTNPPMSNPFSLNERNNLLAGKVAIITGASRGIGAASARVFANAGAAVVLAARNAADLAAVAQSIQAAGGQALAIVTDTSDAAAVERLVQQTLDTYGRLDAAFNNAGAVHMPTPLADIPVEEFDRVVQVNLRGVFLAMKYEIPAMLASGGGAIVNMSSTAGLGGSPNMGAYAASKHGIVGLTKVAALDYATRNIRVNALAPGPIINERIANLPEATREQLAARIPLHRPGNPEEVGAVAAWLCSDMASFITGTTIAVDGGKLASGA